MKAGLRAVQLPRMKKFLFLFIFSTFCASVFGGCVSQEVVVESPKPGELIESPLIVKGEARGYWFFEASFPVKLVSGDGDVLGFSIAQAKGDWMTADFVPFESTLEFKSSGLSEGVLIFEKDNPSGLPEHGGSFTVPVLLKPETIKVKAFFNNEKLDPEFTCVKVFPVEREIPKTLATARAALEELLKGPTDEEKSEGFSTNINSGVKIQKLAIEKGIAKVDFDKQLEFQVGGSCRVAAISHQIMETLKQFSTVSSVVISVDGRTEDILQP